MSINAENIVERKFTGLHMLLVMVSFFGVIIAVNVTMAMFALGSWTGLVVKNSYVASQQFNRDLEAAKIQNDAGFRSELTYSKGTLDFVLMDKNAAPVILHNAYAEIGRPAFEQADIRLAFTAAAPNSYALPIQLDAGIWSIKIFGNLSDQPYRRDARLIVDANGNGRLE